MLTAAVSSTSISAGGGLPSQLSLRPQASSPAFVSVKVNMPFLRHVSASATSQCVLLPVSRKLSIRVSSTLTLKCPEYNILKKDL